MNRFETRLLAIALSAAISAAAASAQAHPPCDLGPATETVRLGQPPNPDVLRPGQTSGPVIGRTWDPVIDHSTFMPDASLDVLVITPDAVNLPIGFGTLLCDGPSLTVASQPGTPFPVPVPNQPILIGISLCSQAVSLNASSLRLTNALDFTLGTTVLAPDVVLTDRGAIRGVDLGGVRQYLGIPYAAAPIGPLRWRAPEPAACWSGIRPATQFGPVCPQLVDPTDPRTLIGDEDCLSLNVWTPDGADGTLPVLFFIHGGSHWHGSSGESTFQGLAPYLSGVRVYDGRHLAERGAVVVTINYRLGALGYLVHPDLRTENPFHAAGNYGLLDQIAALRWVQRNIAAFGGDPSHVLAFGQSAGGVDLTALIASPLAAGLFSRAYVMSGVASRLVSAADGERMANDIAAAAPGCSAGSGAIQCLRGLSTASLFTTLASLGVVNNNHQRWLPVVDGYVLPDTPDRMFANGTHNRMPLIFSTTLDETASLFDASVFPQTAAQLTTLLQNNGFTPAQTTTITSLYLPAYPTPKAAFVALTSDYAYHAPTRTTLRALANSQSQPVYRELFAHTHSNGPLASYGPAHSIDLYYVFGSIWYLVPTSAESALAASMEDYLIRFADTGDPNGGGAPTWPTYGSATDDYLSFEIPIRSGTGVRTAFCDFWDQFWP